MFNYIIQNGCILTDQIKSDDHCDRGLAHATLQSVPVPAGSVILKLQHVCESHSQQHCLTEIIMLKKCARNRAKCFR